MGMLTHAGAFGTDTRPARKPDGRKLWAKDATPGSNDGTRLDATFVNDMAGLLIALCAEYEIVTTEGDDTLLVQALQAAVADVLVDTALTGTPTAPTADPGTDTDQIATTAFVAAAVAALVDSAPALLNTLEELAAALGDDENFAATVTTALSLKAPLDSPALTGTPTAPTAAPGTNTTQLSTTAFVATAVADAVAAIEDGVSASFDTLAELAAAIGSINTALADLAPLASPALTGTPTAPTQSPGDDSTAIATTEYVDAAVGAVGADASGIDFTPAAGIAATNVQAAIEEVLSDLLGGVSSSFDTLAELATGLGTKAAAIVPAAELRTGSATITIPAGATKLKVTLVGGGGGGGGAGTTTNTCGGAGGGGATCIKYLSGLTPGNTLALTVNSGGGGASAGNNAGTAGGSVTLASGTETITTLTAGGGAGGAASGTTAFVPKVGAGGAATNGDLNEPGGGGWSCWSGSAGGVTKGGHSLLSGGAMASWSNAGIAGVAATGHGGGGTGGVDIGGSSNAGGAGSNGAAIFEWYA